MRPATTALAAALILSPVHAFAGRTPELDAMVARHAAANGVPESLVHKVIVKESRYNPRASNAGNYGLMQIRHRTAMGVGYRGSAAGLLDAETNLTFAVKYLAGAYAAAGGNHGRAVALYQRGYYGVGKRTRTARLGASGAAPAQVSAVPAREVGFLERLFGAR